MTLETEQLKFRKIKDNLLIDKRNRPRLRFILIIPIAVFAITPFLWMIRTALTNQADTFTTTPSLWPTNITFDNFIRVLTDSDNNPFGQQFLNTLLIALGASLLAVVVGLSGAFALARIPFKGRSSIGIGIIMVQFFPPVLLAIPLFLVLSNLGISNSLIGLIIAYTALTDRKSVV